MRASLKGRPPKKKKTATSGKDGSMLHSISHLSVKWDHSFSYERNVSTARKMFTNRSTYWMWMKATMSVRLVRSQVNNSNRKESICTKNESVVACNIGELIVS